MFWYHFLSITLLALAAGVSAGLLAAKIQRLAKSIWQWLFPKPIRGVFYTQEFDEDGDKTVRRYVDGKLSAKRQDGERKSVMSGAGSPISDFEYNLDHGDHAEVVKQLRLREA